MSDIIDWDDKLPGFGLRTRDGKCSWVYQYKLNGKNRRIRLGGSELSRAQARKLAAVEKGKLSIAKLGHGIDPATERDQRRAEAKPEPTHNSVAAAIPTYLKAREASLRKRTHLATKTFLEQYWKPLHEMAITKITRADVAVVLTAITENHGPVACNRARSALSGLFAWAIGREYARAIRTSEQTSEKRTARVNARYPMSKSRKSRWPRPRPAMVDF
ncbi:MAG: integrase arm-type DNA-binding domain-containing protein [Xanthobacteraceae bacterium]